MARNLNPGATVTDQIDAGTSFTLQPTATMTIAVWVYATAWTSTGGQNFMFFSADGGNLRRTYMDINNGQTAGSTSFEVNFRGATGDTNISQGSLTLSLNTWIHCAGVYSSSTGGTLYRNGSSVGSGANSGALIQNSGAHCLWGNDAANDRPWQGRLADAAMWNVALSNIEILALSMGARPWMIRRGSLVGYWPIDGFASPEPDLSGNAFNGTLTGTTSAFGPAIMLQTPRWPQFNFLPPPPQVSVSYQRAQQILMTGP
jgi:hypothetical protein